MLTEKILKPVNGYLALIATVLLGLSMVVLFTTQQPVLGAPPAPPGNPLAPGKPPGKPPCPPANPRSRDRQCSRERQRRSPSMEPSFQGDWDGTPSPL